jgi:hypothetical protein
MKIKVQQPIDDNCSEPYRALWSAVLSTALMELKLGPHKPSETLEDRETYRYTSKLEALKFKHYWTKWIESHDFVIVCDYADVEHGTAKSVFMDAYIAAHETYLNGIEMRFTKILRKRTEQIKIARMASDR